MHPPSPQYYPRIPDEFEQRRYHDRQDTSDGTRSCRLFDYMTNAESFSSSVTTPSLLDRDMQENEVEVEEKNEGCGRFTDYFLQI